MNTSELRKQVVDCPRNKSGKRIYTPSLRSKITRSAMETNLSLGAFCRSLDINIATVSCWLRENQKQKKLEGIFNKIDVVDELEPPITAKTTLVLTSPAGFSLSGSSEEILRVWRAIDASAAK